MRYFFRSQTSETLLQDAFCKRIFASVGSSCWSPSFCFYSFFQPTFPTLFQALIIKLQSTIIIANIDIITFEDNFLGWYLEFFAASKISFENSEKRLLSVITDFRVFVEKPIGKILAFWRFNTVIVARASYDCCARQVKSWRPLTKIMARFV